MATQGTWCHSSIAELLYNTGLLHNCLKTTQSNIFLSRTKKSFHNTKCSLLSLCGLINRIFVPSANQCRHLTCYLRCNITNTSDKYTVPRLVKVQLCLDMTGRHIEGAEAQIYSFLTLLVYGGEWSKSQSSCFIPREKLPGTH